MAEEEAKVSFMIWNKWSELSKSTGHVWLALLSNTTVGPHNSLLVFFRLRHLLLHLRMERFLSVRTASRSPKTP
jgi:hypothetical protein